MASAAALCSLAAGCGKKGSPLPPYPRGPRPASILEVRQVGDRVRLTCTSPEPRGAAPGQALARAEWWLVRFPPGSEPEVDPDVFRRRGLAVASVELREAPAGAPVEAEVVPEGAAGVILRYAVRTWDLSGRSSDLTIAPDLVLVETAPGPSDLAAEVTAAGIRLRWDAPPESAAAFNVYRRRGDGPWPRDPLNPEPLDTPAFLDASVTLGARYHYEIRSSLGEGRPRRETAGSNVVTIDAIDVFPPQAPTGVAIVQEGAAVRLFWTPNRERDVRGYRVYRRAPGGEWASIGPTLSRNTWVDRTVVAGASYEYRVAAVDSADPPNESAPSEPVEIRIAREPDAGAEP